MQSKLLKKFSTLYLTIVYGLLYLPIIILILYSFNDSKYSLQWKGFTLKWYASLRDNELLVESALNSLWLATISSTICIFFATFWAVALYRYRFTGRKIIQSLLFIMTMTPDIVMAISLLILFSFFHVKLGLTSLLLSHITFSLPFAIATIYSRLTNSPSSILEAARDLGASEWVVFSKIIFPLILPAVIAAWLLSFTLSLDDVVISFFVTGPSFEILPIKIYSLVRLGIRPEVNAITTCLLIFSILMACLAGKFLKKKVNYYE